MIHLVQLLCPQRHAILAWAWDDRDPSLTVEQVLEDARRMFDVATHLGVMNYRCGICDSSDLDFEDSMTKFRTMLEALPALRACEEEQARARAVIDQIKQRCRN